MHPQNPQEKATPIGPGFPSVIHGLHGLNFYMYPQLKFLGILDAPTKTYSTVLPHILSHGSACGSA